jgi:acid phosphatase
VLAATAALVAAPFGAAHAIPVPAMNHVIVVIMENKSYDEVRFEPYTAGLIANGASFSNSVAMFHPSQPNYIALWSGSTQGVSNDACPASGSPYFTNNLGLACQSAGLTWRSYAENLPAVGSTICATAETSPLYLRRHCPWTYFALVDHNNERPYGDLATDIANNTLPNLAFVIPNNCNNTHNTGCGTAVGDAWLAANLPAMITAVGPTGMVILTWDEDDSSAGNHILTVFKGPQVKTNYVSPTALNHYQVLRTICQALGLPTFGGANNFPSITDVWEEPVPTLDRSWGRMKSIYR